jgi:L-threonylcarbamoyladenylate synthase
MPNFVYHNVEDRGLLCLSALSSVADHLRNGGLAVLPTETGYMLAASAVSKVAVDAAYEVKERSLNATMHVACAGLAMVARFATLSSGGSRLLGVFAPGPITVVLMRRSPALVDEVVLDGTVGIRVPDAPVTLQVIGELGTPLTATSLNASGQSAITPNDAAFTQLNWPKDATVHVVVERRARPLKGASTIVRLTAGHMEVLREGPVTEDALQVALSRPSYPEFSEAT